MYIPHARIVQEADVEAMPTLPGHEPERISVERSRFSQVLLDFPLIPIEANLWLNAEGSISPIDISVWQKQGEWYGHDSEDPERAALLRAKNIKDGSKLLPRISIRTESSGFVDIREDFLPRAIDGGYQISQLELVVLGRDSYCGLYLDYSAGKVLMEVSDLDDADAEAAWAWHRTLVEN